MRGFVWLKYPITAIAFLTAALFFQMNATADDRTERTITDQFEIFSYINYNMEELGITAGQKEKLLSVEENFQSEIRRFADQLKALKVEIESLSWETPYDLRSIDLLVNKKKAILANEQALSERTALLLSDVLTGQQKTRLEKAGIDIRDK